MPETLIQTLLSFDSLVALATLTLLEIVLGIDNIVVLAVVTGKLPAEQQPKARRIGLTLAMVMRVCLLLGIVWIMKLTAPLFTIELGFLKKPIEISWKSIILIIGGGFLIFQATREIHKKVDDAHGDSVRPAGSFTLAIVQICIMDLIFSLDSVITAVGMTETKEGAHPQARLIVMVAAVIIAIAVMMFFAGAISRFVNKHPSVTVLALSFLIMIGVLLLADGFDQHLNRGYVYFAMAFSLVVEVINLRVRAKAAPPK